MACWATSDLTMTELTRRQYAEFSWAIETYHRGIKQYTEVERLSSRSHGGVAEPRWSGLRNVLAAERRFAGRELVQSQDGHHPRCRFAPTLLILD